MEEISVKIDVLGWDILVVKYDQKKTNLLSKLIIR